MKKIIFLIIVLLFCSCSTSLQRNTLHTKIVRATIFQTLDSNSALAFNDQYDVVKFITNEEVYYDGLKISGTFVLVDTYTYETVQHRVKVVPVYVRWSEYKKYIDSNRWK